MADRHDPPPLPADEPLPDEERLLAFYDRLRERIVAAISSRGGRFGQEAAEVLLAAPDVFVLLVRLAADRDVPPASRRLIVGAVAYFLLPVDLLPEALLGPGGFLDDVVLAAAVLNHTLGDDLEPVAGKYWSGSGRVRTVLYDVARSAHALLGERVFSRLQRLLGDRGITLDPAARR